MIILGIETSCDETAISLIEFKRPFLGLGRPKIKILANELISQIKIHEQYGGVFPMMAKREHANNLVPLLLKILEKTEPAKNFSLTEHSSILQNARMDFEKDKILFENIKNSLDKLVRPKRLDAIAVTNGPGLEPCLWTGLNFAKVLGRLWNVPVIPTNHMEGHIVVSLLKPKCKSQNGKLEYQIQKPEFPAISLLISGGHTELVLMKDWGQYEIVGQTKDDAVGEAFDKVARILGLPYPGGPQISELADKARKSELKVESEKLQVIRLPRPMLKSDNLDFSFSGLKTAVLYFVQKIGVLTDDNRKQIAREFEDSVVEVLTVKTAKAIEQFGAKSLILGGGVIANKEIRQAFTKLADEKSLRLFLPQLDHATDNAIMISIAGALNLKGHVGTTNQLIASGNLKLS